MNKLNSTLIFLILAVADISCVNPNYSIRPIEEIEQLCSEKVNEWINVRIIDSLLIEDEGGALIMEEWPEFKTYDEIEKGFKINPIDSSSINFMTEFNRARDSAILNEFNESHLMFGHSLKINLPDNKNVRLNLIFYFNEDLEIIFVESSHCWFTRSTFKGYLKGIINDIETETLHSLSLSGLQILFKNHEKALEMKRKIMTYVFKSDGT